MSDDLSQHSNPQAEKALRSADVELWWSIMWNFFLILISTAGTAVFIIYHWPALAELVANVKAKAPVSDYTYLWWLPLLVILGLLLIATGVSRTAEAIGKYISDTINIRQNAAGTETESNPQDSGGEEQ